MNDYNYLYIILFLSTPLCFSMGDRNLKGNNSLDRLVVAMDKNLAATIVARDKQYRQAEYVQSKYIVYFKNFMSKIFKFK